MKNLITGLIIIFAVLYSGLKYFGMFEEIKISVSREGPFTLVYENHRGSYRETGKIQDKIYNSLKEKQGIDTTRGFGLYFDDPREVKKSELRSIAGCVLDEKDAINKKSLKKLYSTGILPEAKYIYTEFPFKNRISIIFSLFRIYPAISEYMEKNNYPPVPILEIYDVPAKKIRYYVCINIRKAELEKFLK